MKAAADYFYAPASEPVVLADGTQRKVGDEQYLNRLQEFLVREFPPGSAIRPEHKHPDPSASIVEAALSATI